METQHSRKESSLLIKKIKDGDLRAFDLVYSQYSERLYGFAFSILKNHEDAREIVQETFLKLWSKRKQLQSTLSLKSFLFTISYHISIDLIRRRLKDEKYLDYLKAQFVAEESGTDDMTQFNELNHDVQEVIRELPEQRKRIYQLSRDEGLSHAEIADKLAISVKTVENQINLALKAIRKKLNSENLHTLLFFFLFV